MKSSYSFIIASSARKAPKQEPGRHFLKSKKQTGKNKGKIKAKYQKQKQPLAPFNATCGIAPITSAMKAKRNPWTIADNAYLIQAYPFTPIQEMEAHLQRPRSSIYERAFKLKLHRDPAYKEALQKQLGKQLSCHPHSKALQFAKGHQPANKGKRQHQYMSAEALQRTMRTRFSKGHQPRNIKPIGYESIHSDGYVYIKTQEGKPMQLKARVVYAQHHGPIPPGMCVGYHDGNRANCSPSNLYLFPESQKAARNWQAMTPQRRQDVKNRMAESRRKSIERDKRRIRWGMEPIGKVVKRWHDIGH